MFPLLHRSGPIEACRPGVGFPCQRQFPLLHRSGPIEAPFKAARDQEAGFRSFIGAAPLKQAEDENQVEGVPGFRSFIGAAPLKLDEALDHIEGTGSFRSFIGAAPLKRRRVVVVSWLHSMFPLLHRSGPIEAPCEACCTP